MSITETKESVKREERAEREEQESPIGCCICLSHGFLDPRRLPCGHYFCNLCLQTQISPVCALCRQSFSKQRLRKPLTWKIQIGFLQRSCPKCGLIQGYAIQTCGRCIPSPEDPLLLGRVKLSLERAWVLCRARILWMDHQKTRIHVMLNRCFMPDWSCGCSNRLALFELHPDGKMSHFNLIESKVEKDLELLSLGRKTNEICPHGAWNKYKMYKKLWNIEIPQSKPANSLQWNHY